MASNVDKMFDGSKAIMKTASPDQWMADMKRQLKQIKKNRFDMSDLPPTYGNNQKSNPYS